MKPTSVETTIVALAGASPIWQGLIGVVVITLMNTIGALLILVWRRPSERFLDAALGFAAAAMLYVISNEIVPETHRKGHERLATFGTMIGVIVMLYLDIALS